MKQVVIPVSHVIRCEIWWFSVGCEHHGPGSQAFSKGPDSFKQGQADLGAPGLGWWEFNFSHCGVEERTYKI